MSQGDKNTLEQLYFFVKTGRYCLHGSQKNIPNIVESRQANCKSGRPESNMMAIYATTDSRIAIFRALVAKVKAKEPSNSFFIKEFGFLSVGGENICYKSGYVYVLPITSFKKVGCELISTVPVVLERIILVNPSILHLLKDFHSSIII